MELDIAGKEIKILRIGQRNETLATTNNELDENIEVNGQQLSYTILIGNFDSECLLILNA
jgi:hypothetical protein